MFWLLALFPSRVKGSGDADQQLSLGDLSLPIYSRGQGSTNFPKIYESLTNSRRQKSDMEHFAY